MRNGHVTTILDFENQNNGQIKQESKLKCF